MLELNDFDFVDEKVDKGKHVETYKPEETFDEVLDTYEDEWYDTTFLMNTPDGVYVKFNSCMDNGVMFLTEFCDMLVATEAFQAINVKDGKIIK